MPLLSRSVLKDLISDTARWGFNVGLGSPPTTPMGGLNNGVMDNAHYNNNNNNNNNNKRLMRTRCITTDTVWRDSDSRFHSSMPSVYSTAYHNEKDSTHQKEGDNGNGTPACSTGDDVAKKLSLQSATVDQIWSFYAKESTCHGLKNVVETHRRPWMRIAWLVIVLGMLIVLVFTVIDLLVDYQNHSTVTRTDFRVQTRPDFPSVTFCNNSPFKNINGTKDNPMFTLMAKNTILSKFLPIDFSDPEVLKLLGMSSVEVNEAYSFTKDDLFKVATYEKHYLNISRDFETVETPSGRCFTFNGPNYIAKYGVRKASFDGRKSGLRVVVDIKQSMYLPSDGLSAGIRVFVSHHPDTPRFEQDGLDIPPGTSSRVALSPVKFKFLPHPFASYGSEYCHNIEESGLLKKMTSAPFYSQHSCVHQCQTLTASRMCNCYSHALCEMKAGNINVSCDCPRPCEFTRYNAISSVSKLSSTPTHDFLRRMINASSIEQLREDFLEIRVFLDSMLIRMESHEPRYTLASILGFLGGQMGFFMGASLMTIAELVETMVLTAAFFIQKLFRMGRMN